MARSSSPHRRRPWPGRRTSSAPPGRSDIASIPVHTGMVLEMAADGMGERVAVGARKDGLTYRGLLEQARRVAAVVAESGTERLVSVGRNSALLPALLFGSGL